MKKEHEGMHEKKSGGFGGKKGSSKKGVGMSKKETGFSAKVGKNNKGFGKETASPLGMMK